MKPARNGITATVKVMASRPQVLIVEDERDVAARIKHSLERNGDADAEIIATGDTALREVGNRAVDLVILDLNLPVLDGVEVCRVLRSRDATRHLPVLMLTASTSEDDRVNGLELGADDYVTKPSALNPSALSIRPTPPGLPALPD